MNLVMSYLHQNWEQLNLGAYGQPGNSTYVAITPRFRASSHVVLLILLRGQSEPSLVAKVSRLKEQNESLEREALNLRTLSGYLAGEDGSLPRVVACDSYKGSRLLIETALVGQLMGAAKGRDGLERSCQQVVDWLHRLQRLTGQAIDVDWFDILVERPSRRLEALLPATAEEARLLEQTRALVWPFRQINLPRVFEHGDLSHPNIILLKDGGIGVVDWELARADGIPTHDLFFFLDYVARAGRRSGNRLSTFHKTFFEPGSWIVPYVRGYIHQLHLSTQAVKALFVLCWFRYMVITLDRLQQFDNKVNQLSANLVQWLRASRNYASWRYAVINAGALALVA